ncbi:hypothetical protein AB4Y42_02335 [Paraburkholderia sp. EG286B]|uniref:hypothetical protein n=1 Tax=Paraburkholderia sp. EG286B TaxID=3237011 RepID=UPI0034D2E3DA
MSTLRMTVAEFAKFVGANEPISPNRMVDISGYIRQDIDRYVRRARDEKLIFVSGYGPSPVRKGRRVKLYSCGVGPDVVAPPIAKKKKVRKRTGTRTSQIAVRASEERKLRRKRELNFIPKRDPLTEAFFGPAPT